MSPTLTTKTGTELTEADLSACIEILKEGERVNIRSAKEELLNAHFVVFLCDADRIVGLGVIKRARPGYADDVSSPKKSHHHFDPGWRELGYIAIRTPFRGKGQSSRIIDELLRCFDGPLWATTSEPRMMTSLGKRGFQRKGKEWPSSRGEANLSLWVKEGA
jgi:hypothetical protein